MSATPKAWSQISDMHREARDKPKLERLQSVVRERAGHWLALQVEEAKIALSNAAVAQIDIGRIAAGETVTLHRARTWIVPLVVWWLPWSRPWHVCCGMRVSRRRDRHRVFHRQLQQRAIAA